MVWLYRVISIISKGLKAYAFISNGGTFFADDPIKPVIEKLHEKKIHHFDR